MPSKQEQALEESQQQKKVRQRRSLNDAYAAVTAQQATSTFSAFTFEDALDLQIERIEGAGTKLRPNVLDQLQAIKLNVQKTVEELKAVPAESFQDPDEEEDVNTA